MKPRIRILLVPMILSLLSCNHFGRQREHGPVITNSVGMKLVYIPAGEFRMGSSETENADEIPKHRVLIGKGFYMGQTEVTLGQFKAFTEDTLWETLAERQRWSYAWRDAAFEIVYGASFVNTSFPQASNQPVVCVSWDDAVEFCRWLGHREGRHYRLPTEAEWEYACRAGTETAYQWGDGVEGGALWCNAGDLTAKEEFSKIATPSLLCPWYDGYVFTAPVGSFRPNAFGLHDMHGNVLEFCNDWYDADYYEVSPVVDPRGPSAGEFRVLRGGDWGSYPNGCRAAKRYRDRPSIRSSNLGFRVVMEPNDL